MAYTNNYCLNPAFQLGLSGYNPLQDASVILDSSNVLYGTASLFVTCPGNEAGEGCTTAAGTVPVSATSSASCFLQGTGNVTVYAIMSPGNQVVASISVMLTNSWQRVVLSGIPVTGNQSIYLTVQTTTAMSAQFWLSGVQIEDTSPAHPYCDGDQIGCIWVNNTWGGPSRQLYPNPVAAVSASRTSSNVVNILARSEAVFIVPLVSSSHSYEPWVVIGSAGPAGAVTDYSVALLTDPDPAQAYVSWNNAGQAAPSSGYNRSFAVFIPPQDYLVSNGTYLYNRAAFAAVGWWYQSVPSSNTIELTRVQTEVLPLTTGYSAPSPSNFDPPRAVHSIIVANRINFCNNPSIEVSTSNWSPTGSATLSQDNTVNVGQIAEYDDTIITTGTHSMKVTINSSGDGAQITIPSLITGYTYIASVYVQAGAGLANILMSIANGSTSVQSVGGTGYNFGAYNAGPYGGYNPTMNVTTGTWYRIWCVFTATADSHQLLVTSSSGSGISYPAHMWIDACLVEQGEVLGGYFDGSSGKNYSWDSQAGSPGLAASYYYDQQAVKEQAVLNTLNKHLPLGISYAQPLYSVPPIQ
jgi:hypothetical protein